MADTNSSIYGAIDAVAVTPGSNSIRTTRALYVGTAGDVTVTMASGNSVTFSAVPAGTILPVQASKVTAAPANTLALY